ncbi:MAG TPA: hypothetical protein VN931_09440 [Fibrobacteria bacterium]|nr:hypothetical protein [Fibrobacteria bacterium]
MKARTRHGLFLVLAIPALAGSGIGILSALHLLQAPGMRALAWATAAAGLHAGLGWGLWSRDSRGRGAGVAGGLFFLVLRFTAGVAMFVTGIVANRSAERDFAIAWAGMFLILTVSESIIFVQGVQEL